MTGLEANDFWEASSLHAHNAAAFGSRVAAYRPVDRGVHPFAGSAGPVALRPVRDRLQRLFAARRSGRAFGDTPLTARQVERILASVGAGRDGSPVVPSAGGLGSLHTFCLGLNVRGPCAGRMVRYGAREHAVFDVGPVPAFGEVRRLFGLRCDGIPQLVLVFISDTSELLRKYGPRGMRFVLREAGHAAQNVGLRLARDGLAGCVLGGSLDREVLALLRLSHADAVVTGAMACGRV